MSIVGIETIVYGVNDVVECARYFVDFGLPLVGKSESHAHFRLEEGSNVILRQIADSKLAKTSMKGTGVVETIWGVDRQASLDKLIADLSSDRKVTVDSDGTAHSHDDAGLPIGLRLYRKNPVRCAPDPINSPGNANRINTHRKWKVRARPKTIQHVVYQVPDFDKAWAFYRDRLSFRLSDVQKTFGIFGRADGANDHHNIYFLNSRLPFPGMDGSIRFDHVNYGVEDIDEVMVGANYMQRQGWPKSEWGLGRHRIASSLFMYLPCPTGGQAEYGADSDHLDDSWIPRVWNPMFGFFSFISNMAPFMMDAAPWEWEYAPGYTPAPRAKPHLPGTAEPQSAHPTKDPAPAQTPGFS
jgi:catechol 2,3-dioxygenase-like lactoylglutathione lyase family enzyme